MRTKAAVVGVSVVVALAAIIGFTTFRSRVVHTPSGAASSPALRLAPDIEITMYQGQGEVGGEKIALSDLWEKKRQPVVLNFWAGLCPPCRAEMPDFQRLYDLPDRKFALIGIDIGSFIDLGSRDDARALLRELKITYPAGTTLDIRTLRNYTILGMPTTVFITADGRMWRKHTGLLTFNQIKALAGELIRGSSSP
jgi:cytochrome c biogenesis protein CcmG, thiol:disulfide interchange protein DsbE